VFHELKVESIMTHKLKLAALLEKEAEWLKVNVPEGSEKPIWPYWTFSEAEEEVWSQAAADLIAIL
jgi:hypothetical protein